jgi:Protein of unknown function (DUF3106)
MRHALSLCLLFFISTAVAMPGVEQRHEPLDKASLISAKKFSDTAPPKHSKEHPSLTWASLSDPHKEKLLPLQKIWGSLSPNQKKKWLEIAQLMPKLPQLDQEKISTRMHDWVSLSAEQRTLARFNFLSSKQVTPDERQKQWLAYQALSDAEREDLRALSAPDQIGTTAPSVKPATLASKVLLPARPLTQPAVLASPLARQGTQKTALALPQPAKRMPKIAALVPLGGKRKDVQDSVQNGLPGTTAGGDDQNGPDWTQQGGSPAAAASTDVTTR